MDQFQIRENEEFIKLGQLLKAIGWAESGVDAKFMILEEVVKVNGEVCAMRGKKLYHGDVVEFDGKYVKIVK